MKKLALLLAALLMFSSVSALAVDWNEEGLPIVNEPYSFSIFLDDSGLPEDKIMFPILEEMTGITIDWQMAPYAVQTENSASRCPAATTPTSSPVGFWATST